MLRSDKMFWKMAMSSLSPANLAPTFSAGVGDIPAINILLIFTMQKWIKQVRDRALSLSHSIHSYHSIISQLLYILTNTNASTDEERWY